MTNPRRLEYATAAFTLRAHRVVVLFRGDEQWRKWARLALSVASRTWGGGGFLLVPYHQDGSVDDRFFALVRAYDPDHVALLGPTLLEAEEILPGSVRVQVDGELVVGDPLLDLLRDVSSIPLWDDGVGEVARELVAGWCTPLTHDIRRGEPGRRVLELLRTDSPNRPLVEIEDMTEAGSGVCLAADPLWNGDVMLGVGAHIGFTAEPTPGRTAPNDDTVLPWLLHPEGGLVPKELLWSEYGVSREPPSRPPTWFGNRVGMGLTRLQQTYPQVHSVVVVGDTVEDFALAVCYDRLAVHAAWISPSAFEDDRLLALFAMEMEMDAIGAITSVGTEMYLTSATLRRRELEAIKAQLLSAPSPLISPQHGSHLERLLNVGAPALQAGGSFLGIDDPFDVRISLPVMRDEDGTIAAAVALVAPLPSSPLKLRASAPDPYWMVDAAVFDAATPSGRGLPSSSLFDTATGAELYETEIRSARRAISYSAQHLGLVVQGQNPAARQARPRIRLPGLKPWIQEVARSQGIKARLSMAGVAAELVARRLGGREQLIDFVSALLPVLTHFKEPPRKARTDDVFQPGQGVVIDHVTYPTIYGLRRAMPSTLSGQLRAALDRLLEARLLRRGLVLGCVDCGRPSFIGIDDLAQGFSCPRCGATNQLTAGRWKRIGDEPLWYYDLHASFRAVLNGNAHVGLLAAAKLRRNAYRYADVAELEFVENGAPFAEIDLIAAVDDELVIVEAKTTARLAQGPTKRAAEADKKLKVAALLGADAFALATDAQRWSPQDYRQVQTRVPHAHLRPGFRVDTMPGLTFTTN